jgi:2-methylisocitrate lyase-like PEP mutase family enzyme
MMNIAGASQKCIRRNWQKDITNEWNLTLADAKLALGFFGLTTSSHIVANSGCSTNDSRIATYGMISLRIVIDNYACRWD